MWTIGDQERPLTEHEWACFKLGLILLVDAIDIANEAGDDAFCTGVSLFDRQTYAQKLGLLAKVAEALADDELPAPELTAPVEATIAAILQLFWSELETEIEFDFESPPVLEVRRMLLAALQPNEDYGIEELEFELPAEDEEQKSEWQDLFTIFQDRFLQDYDFQLDDALDLPPDKAQEFREILGIRDNFFSDVAEDPTGKELAKVRQKLALLLGLDWRDDDGLYLCLMDHYTGLKVGPCTPNVIEDWQNNPWITVAREVKPHFHCEYRVWLHNFSQPLLTESTEQMQDVDAFYAAQTARRDKALEDIGYI